MTYRIARNGQVFGPYTLTELQQYIATGNVLPADLVQGEAMQEWLPVAQMFPAAQPAAPPQPGGLPRFYRDPPDLPWVAALLLGIFTMGLFFQAWDIVEAAWMRRVNPASIALYLYIAEGLVYLLKLPVTVASVSYNLGFGPAVEGSHSTLLTLTGIVLFFATRLTLRKELLQHFNSAEPVGLRLSWFFTMLFGGLYFQYHFNRINGLKRHLRVSVPIG
jgi:hypothetical protein